MDTKEFIINDNFYDIKDDIHGSKYFDEKLIILTEDERCFYDDPINKKIDDEDDRNAKSTN